MRPVLGLGELCLVWIVGLGRVPAPCLLRCPSPPPAGPRHFLLLCAVRPEDAGCIRFVARTAASEASLQVEGSVCVGWPGSSAVAVTRSARGVPMLMSLPHGVPVLMSLPRMPALPIRIVKPLRDKTVLARHKATLECTVSHARGRVRWLRGDTEIFAGDKYEICNLDCYRTLIIHRVGPEDEDSYTCDAFDDRSTARLLVEGEWGGGPTGTGLCWEPPAVTHSLPGSCAHPWHPALTHRRLEGLMPGVVPCWDTPCVPTTPRDADWLCPRRELGAGTQHGGCMQMDGQMAVLGDGVAFPPGHTWGDHLHPAPASWLCIKQPVFFLTWLLPPQRWVPAQHSQVAGPHGAQTSGSRSPPAPRRSPHRGTPAPKGSLLCGRGLSSVWHIYKRGWEGGQRRGAADTAWQKHAAPGAAAGDEMAPRGGHPALVPLPSCLRGSPGSLRNKLIQITAREVCTRQEPLSAAALWAGAPALPRRGAAPRPPQPLQNPVASSTAMASGAVGVPEAARPHPKAASLVLSPTKTFEGDVRGAPPPQLMPDGCHLLPSASTPRHHPHGDCWARAAAALSLIHI